VAENTDDTESTENTEKDPSKPDTVPRKGSTEKPGHKSRNFLKHALSVVPL